MQHNIGQPFRINLVMVFFITVGAIMVLHLIEHRAGGE